MEIYIAKNKSQMGPYDIGQVTQMLQSGILDKHDLYWHEGMLDWAPVGAIAVPSRSESVLVSDNQRSIFPKQHRSPLPSDIPVQYNHPNITISTSSNHQPSNANSHNNQSQGIVVGGYICSFVSLLFLPPAFGIAGLVLGIICLARGKIGHGVAIVVLSITLAIFGVIFGAAMYSHK